MMETLSGITFFSWGKSAFFDEFPRLSDKSFPKTCYSGFLFTLVVSLFAKFTAVSIIQHSLGFPPPHKNPIPPLLCTI